MNRSTLAAFGLLIASTTFAGAQTVAPAGGPGSVASPSIPNPNAAASPPPPLPGSPSTGTVGSGNVATQPGAPNTSTPGRIGTGGSKSTGGTGP